MDARVYRVYVSCREGMDNTPEDWEKVFDAFKKVWTPALDKDIQACILKLEEHFKGQEAQDGKDSSNANPVF